MTIQKVFCAFRKTTGNAGCAFFMVSIADEWRLSDITHTTPHHTTPHHTTPHHTTPHHTTPHHTTPHHTTPHHTTPHHTTPHNTTPHHTTPHHITASHHTTHNTLTHTQYLSPLFHHNYLYLSLSISLSHTHTHMLLCSTTHYRTPAIDFLALLSLYFHFVYQENRVPVAA